MSNTGLEYGQLTLWEAARAIVARRGGAIYRDSVDAAFETLERAAEAGTLTVRHPETLLPQVYSEWSPPSSSLLVCTQADLNAWLTAVGVPYHLQFGSSNPAPRPKQRGQAQEDAILAKLTELDYNPQALPRAPAGKASPAKQAVRDALKYPSAVFDKAWQRLRADGRIRDA